MAAAVAIAVAVTPGSTASTADDLTLIGDELLGGIFVLVALALVVGIIASRTGQRSPDLDADIQFRFCEPNKPVLVKAASPGPSETPLMTLRKASGGVGVEVFPQLEARLRIHNRRPWTVRNAALTISFVRMALPATYNAEGWLPSDFDQGGNILGLQWEGRSDQSVPGHRSRELPRLDLSGLRAFGTEPPAIDLDLAAEGFYRRKTVRVKLVSLEEWNAQPASIAAEVRSHRDR